MKIKLFTMLLAAGVTGAAAQNAPLNPTQLRQDFRRHVQTMLDLSAPDAQRTTATSQRVIGAGRYQLNDIGAWALADSARFRYSGGNGSEFSFNTMQYEPNYQSLVSFGLYPYMNEKLKVRADSFWRFTTFPGPGLNNTVRYASTYTNTGSIASQQQRTTYSTPLDTGTLYYNYYDSQDRMTRLYVLTYSDVTNTWDSSQRRDLVYNAQGRIIGDTVYTYDLGDWLPNQALNWNYDAAGNISAIGVFYAGGGGQWFEVLRYNHTFNAANRLTRTELLLDQSNGLEPFFADTIGWNSAGTFVLYEEFQQYDGSAYVPFVKLTKHVGPTGLPDTSYTYYRNASGADSLSSLEVFTYNTNNLPDLAKKWTVTTTATTYDEYTRYYYETYTAVSDVDQSRTLLVYPNPTTDVATLNHQDVRAGSVVLLNAIGQHVLEQTLRPGATNTQINLANLPAGMYIAILRDEAGRLLRQARIVKR